MLSFFQRHIFIYYRMLLQSGAQSIKHAGRYFEKFIKVAHAKNATGRHKNLLPANLHSMPEMKPIKAISKKNWKSRLLYLAFVLKNWYKNLYVNQKIYKVKWDKSKICFFQKPTYVRKMVFIHTGRGLILELWASYLQDTTTDLIKRQDMKPTC